MRKFAESRIDREGRGYVLWITQEPRTNHFGLWEGGTMYSFDFDHKRNMTELHRYTYKNGAPVWEGLVKRWRDEILGPSEQLELMRMAAVQEKQGGM